CLMFLSLRFIVKGLWSDPFQRTISTLLDALERRQRSVVQRFAVPQISTPVVAMRVQRDEASFWLLLTEGLGYLPFRALAVVLLACFGDGALGVVLAGLFSFLLVRAELKGKAKAAVIVITGCGGIWGMLSRFRGEIASQSLKILWGVAAVTTMVGVVGQLCVG